MRCRVLVVTEGEITEPQYVEALRQHLRSRDSSVVVKCHPAGKDPERVVRQAMRLRDEEDGDASFDHVVCLVDVDQHARLEEALRLAEAEGILVLVSNLKFEVWLRWHYEAARSAESSKTLDRLMKEFVLLRVNPLSPQFPIEKVSQACTVAWRADPELAPGRTGPDPSSAMPVLVELMRTGRL